jgi:hypothetical protein
MRVTNHAQSVTQAPLHASNRQARPLDHSVRLQNWCGTTLGIALNLAEEPSHNALKHAAWTIVCSESVVHGKVCGTLIVALGNSHVGSMVKRF